MKEVNSLIYWNLITDLHCGYNLFPNPDNAQCLYNIRSCFYGCYRDGKVTTFEIYPNNYINFYGVNAFNKLNIYD